MDFLTSTTALPLFLVMLAAALLSPIAARILRIPASVSLIGIGMLAGLPFLGLGTSALEGASSIGLVFAFFLMGSAIDTSRLGRLGTRALLFALVAFASALLLGWLLGTRILGLGAIDALLVGVVFGAAAPFSKHLAARLEPTEARDSTSLQAANELGEIFRLLAFIILLALRGTKSLVGFVEAPWALGLLGSLAGAIAIVLFLTFFGSHWFGRSTRAAGLGFLVFSLAGFGAAALGILIGLPPAFASFVSGLALGRFAPEGSLLQERMLFVGRNLFLPLTLVPAGMGLTGLLTGDAQRAGFSVVAAIVIMGLAIIPRFLAGLALLPFGPPSRLRLLAGLAAAPGQEPSTLFFVLYLASAGLAKDYGPSILIGLLPALWLLEAIGGGQGGQEARRQRSASLPGAALGRRNSRTLAQGDIIVALANPGSATGLLSLAFLLRPRGTTSALRATVVCEAEGNEREMERAENLLAQAMVAARDANLSLTPSMVTAPSVAEGLIESGAGLAASTVILGWNRAPQTASAFSAGIAETLLARTDALVVVARPGRGFEGMDRLTLVLPPGVEKHEDAEKVAGLIGGMLAASGAGLTVLVQKPGGGRARSLLASLRPRGGIEIEELDSWKQAAKSSRARSRAASSNRPAYIVLCGRPGSAGWHPSFDSLPRDFASAFPESPLAVIYPPTMDESVESLETKLGLFDEALEGNRVLVSMGEAAITDAIRRLLATFFDADRKTLVRLSSLFTGIAQKEAIELEPGVILLHAHVPDVSAPLLFFGATMTPWRLLALDEPVKVLVILCAPEGQGPKRHLATLGELARLFKDGSLGRRLAEAREVGEFRGAIDANKEGDEAPGMDR